MKQLFYCILILNVLVSCSRDNMVVRGKISGGERNMVYFEEVDVYQTRLLDSLTLKSHGKFRFGDNSRYPKFYQLRFSNNKTIGLLLEPGENAKIKADLQNIHKTFQVSGSEGTRHVNQINRELDFARKQMDSISALFSITEDTVLKDSLIKEFEKVMDNHRKFTITFLLTCSNSLASFMALFQEYSENTYVLNKVKDLQYFKIVTDSLVKRYPRVKQVIVLKETTQKMLNNYYSQKLLSMAQDADYGLPEISLPDINDKTIGLKSLKGKYVLLSFWSTWHKESSDYNLGLKEVYKRYAGKGFEIYHVSLDKSISSWRSAVRFDELNWINVVDTAFPNSQATAIYNVQSLPANFLIDKDFSTILAKDINPLQLDTKLAKLLQ